MFIQAYVLGILTGLCWTGIVGLIWLRQKLADNDINEFEGSNRHEKEHALINFDNAKFGNVCAILINDTLWFIGKYVATALAYKNPRKALKDHVPDKYKLTE